MYNQYSLRISSDEGTWTFNLPADTVQTKTYTITADMITQTESLRTFTVNATRNNATSLTFYYNDPSEETISVTTLIQHYNLGSLVTDYTQTDLANTQTFTLYNVTEGTNYIANVTATRNNDVQTWQIEIPAPNAGLVWTSAFDPLGTFPIPTYQLPALAICILFFGIGNWRDSEAVCLLVIIVCGVLQIIGWGSFPLPGLIMAGMIAFYKKLSKKIHKQLNDQKALKDGTLALLRNQIIQNYDKYMDRERIPIYAIENVLELYNAYHTLGGNGTITKLVDELKELPSNNQKQGD
jgi:hypothetical protein